jgi:hypothetical protein
VKLVTPISQTAPQLKIVTGVGEVSLEGKYYVKVRSYLIQEFNMSPEFEFEVYLHPHPCLKTSLVGSATITALAYKIEIVPTPGTTTFPKFTSTVNNAAAVESCTPLKYTITCTNAAVLALLAVDASTTHTSIGSIPAKVFSVADAATNVKLNWGPTEVDSLLGDHVFTMAVTMLNFPDMDYIAK